VAIFDDRVVLVTGASRGIGRAIARQFAAAGARVVVHYRADAAAAEETLRSLDGSEHIGLAADVADPADVAGLVNTVVERLGTIDVLVNNAAVYTAHPILETTYPEWQDAWRRTLETNLFGPANLVHQVAKVMVTNGGGRIVNVSSRGAFRGEPDHPAYGASKAGLNSFGQSMAHALAAHGIYVTTVAPGYVETDMAASYLTGDAGAAVKRQSPLDRAAEPDEIARMVLFLATPGTEYATGAVVDVNGASYLRT
jgi:NAD(P)-dependent dehydrogenase (short-subunit alcohol dehydrogenase family)